VDSVRVCESDFVAHCDFTTNSVQKWV